MENNHYSAQKDKELILSIIKYILVGAVVFFTLYAGVRILFLLLPVIIGFVLAFITNKFSFTLYRFFSFGPGRKSHKVPDSGGYRFLKLASFTLMLAALMLFVVLIVLALISQIRNLILFITTDTPSSDLIRNIAAALRNLSADAGGFLPPSVADSVSSEIIRIQEDLISLIPRVAATLLNSLLGIAGNIPLVIFRIVVVLLSGYYFITDRASISRFIYRTFPSKTFVTKATTVVRNLSSSLFRVMGGYLLILTITFIEALIGLTIIGMPYAVVIALVVTMIDILPGVGASACFVPVSIYMFYNGNIWQGIVALAFVGIITSVRSFLDPKIIGSAMKLHPLATLTAMILGIAVFGVIGIIAGPALLVLVLGIMDSFGFEGSVRNWTGKILDRISENKSIINEIKTGDDTSVARLIIMIKLKNKNFSSEDRLSEILSVTGKKIPYIIYMDFAKNTEINSPYDYLITIEFAGRDDLELFRTDPVFRDIMDTADSISEEKIVSDYIIQSEKLL